MQDHQVPFKIQTFNESSIILRMDEVFGFGELLDCFVYDNFTLYLYRYNDFYVEVKIDEVKDKLIGIVGILAENALEKYIPQNQVESKLDQILRAQIK